MREIYISGPISNRKNYKRVFDRAEKILKEKGYKVINPVTIGTNIKRINKRIGNSTAYSDYLLVDIIYLFSADEICMLRGWQQSPGARAEYAIAKALNLPIIYENANAEIIIDSSFKQKKCIPCLARSKKKNRRHSPLQFLQQD